MSQTDLAVTDLLARREAAARLEAADPIPTSSGLRELSRGWSLTDGQLALVVSAALFVLAAWPLALTEVPPYQDLPNHLAAVTVIEHPEKYPNLVFNGFLKTNAALFAWLYVVGKLVGVKLASRLFALLVLALNAITIPRLVLQLTGSRKKMIVAALFAWPMIHNWFVSMGMLDFALGVPLSLALLMALDRQRKAPSLVNGVVVTGLGLVTWYAHVFPLLVVHMLVGIHILEQRGGLRPRLAAAKRLLLPLVPVTALVAVSTYTYVSETVTEPFLQQERLLASWELVYNLWAEWFWGFTKLSMSSLVPCVLLGVYGAWGFWRREKSPPFFSGIATMSLALLYCFAPYKVTAWCHVNSRLIPFIFFALLLRLPERLPKQVTMLLGISALLYSAAMGADFIRLEKDRQRFIAGMSAVPENATLLPLLFQHKGVSDNTRSLLHAWGFYVVEKETSAPLLFAHSKSFPLTYRQPPPVRFNHLVLETFATNMAHKNAVCELMAPVTVNDCEAEYRQRWAEFWADAEPRFDHVLLWAPTPEALALVPPSYRTVFRQDELVIMARDGAPESASR